jgi:hypothetical protein
MEHYKGVRYKVTPEVAKRARGVKSELELMLK